VENIFGIQFKLVSLGHLEFRAEMIATGSQIGGMGSSLRRTLLHHYCAGSAEAGQPLHPRPGRSGLFRVRARRIVLRRHVHTPSPPLASDGQADGIASTASPSASPAHTTTAGRGSMSRNILVTAVLMDQPSLVGVGALRGTT
jgi:hypothetical protein